MTDSSLRPTPSGPWPLTTDRNERGEITIGGVSLVEITERYGSPVYVFDEATIRHAARSFRTAMEAAYPRVRVVYAGKAFLTTALIPIVHDEGIGLDVVSGGELFVGLRGGMPAAQISMHGNNKSARELNEAIVAGVGKIVIDNEHEIDLLERITADRGVVQNVMIRVNPGVDVHTHRKISTGVADSKFGFPISDGQAERAIARIVGVPGLNLVGLHAHVGSQLFDTEAHLPAIDDMLAFATSMRDRHGLQLEHFSPGGGFGIAYTDADTPLTVETWTSALGSRIIAGCERHGLDLPVVTIEPGRAIAGPSAVAVYQIGSTKHLPGIRTYVSVDGGMADNIRPALYDARYTAAIANRVHEGAVSPVTIAGKFCESGDLLIEGVELPPPAPGDLLAIPAAGAYTLSMASNYNMAPRPAVVLVNEGASRVIRRRETYEDLARHDLP